ncbi:alpha/beta hydrolase-fold protein [Arenibacter sp. F26102]|uniref:alpha/beta hydrolase n=1 Tax=Arenibacter sp. F26102 TaxID=2926416 RepID=UPI001FF24CD0|nr:alpha/beta hydrolase-fold protein [Arenibacter sp. F26102]MCK0145397.1 alpha/beta hydrolase-fold protein [Arenibacter sp. F26102]
MSNFRTVELSDEAFENAGLRFLTIKTNNLKGRGDICLFIPEMEEELTDLPIYILLHGVYGSSWAWAMKGGAHITAKRLMDKGDIGPAIIAMPSDGLWGDGSGYLSHKEKDFAQWIVSDVPAAIIETIAGATINSPLCIGGLSMGGYGALMLGGQFPHKFKAISAHSAITKFEQMANFVGEPLERYAIQNTNINVIDVLQKNKKKLPAIRFDCGTKDSLLEANRTLHNELSALNINHNYEEFEGGHEWPYWQKNVEATLRFFYNHIK